MGVGVKSWIAYSIKCSTNLVEYQIHCYIFLMNSMTLLEKLWPNVYIYNKSLVRIWASQHVWKRKYHFTTTNWVHSNLLHPFHTYILRMYLLGCAIVSTDIFFSLRGSSIKAARWRLSCAYTPPPPQPFNTKLWVPNLPLKTWRNIL